MSECVGRDMVVGDQLVAGATGPVLVVQGVREWASTDERPADP